MTLDTVPTGADCTRTADPLSVHIRPLRPSDEATLRAIWLQGWEATLVQVAPRVWRDLTRKARLVIAVFAAVAVAVFGSASFLGLLPSPPPPQPPLLQWMTPLLPAGGLESLPAAAALVLHAVAAVPGWMLAAAVALVAAPAAVSKRLQMQILRALLHHRVRAWCPDMWDVYGSWARPAAGRQYWVAELLPDGRVVGGVAVKMGAAVRPLLASRGKRGRPEPGSDRTENLSVEGENRSLAERRLDTLPAGLMEDVAGFTEGDVKGHGSLEGTDAVVYRMVTDVAVRRRGIGRRLMEKVVESATEVGVRRLMLATANADAITFYEKACGFEPRPGVSCYGGGKVLWRSVGVVTTTATAAAVAGVDR